MTKQNIASGKKPGTGLSAMRQFFHADGTFNEPAFRTSIRESITSLKQKGGEALASARSWIISYIEEITSYLNDRGLQDNTLLLLTTAIEEAEREGIKNITLPIAAVKDVLSHASRTHPSRTEKKAGTDSMKNKIFESALHIFAKKGFHGTTIDEIAAASGVGKGTVYRSFKSKDDLLEQLLAEKYNDIISRITNVFTRDEDVLLQIEEMIVLWVNFIEDNHVVYRLIQNEAITGKSGERTQFYDFFITRLPIFRERILELYRRKLIKATSFYTVFYGILGFIDGVVQKWFRQGMNKPLSDEIPVILEVLFNGFVGEKRSGRHYNKKNSKRKKIK
jgi:AcrR family transcriptional regulator